MRRSNMLTFSVAVFGVLLIGVIAPYSQWGRSAPDNVEVPTVSASWTETGTAVSSRNELAHVTAVVPPYIILEAISNQGKHVVRQPEIRITIETMSGSYSEYVASKVADPKALLVLLVSSNGPGSINRSLLALMASN